MPTEKLYYENVYLRAFTARVLSCAKGGKGWEVVLDRSAFYPEGGGQPGDTGVLGGVRVLDTREREEEIVHLCAGPLEPGETVEGAIDWERRFDLMQQHSGEHIVSGIVHRHWGYDNVGFHMGADVITIDFSGVLSREQLSQVERLANEAVWQNRPFQVFYPSPEELKTLPYRSKKELTGRVRLVSCPGMDLCACCGTHVTHAGEIGLIKLLSVQRFREGVRVEMLAGGRAYDYVNACLEQNHRVSMLLSARVEETAPAVERLLEESAAAKYRLTGLENRLFAAKAETARGKGDLLLFEEGLMPDGVRRLCDAVMQTCGGRCAVFSGDDAGGYRYAVGQTDGQLGAFVREMNAALRGRGGGKPRFVQGSVAASRAEIEDFFGRE
ncbi:MAG: alanyl-tRNA editing protein [Oscillospiraceae bacterium]